MQILSPAGFAPAIAPYSQGVRSGQTIYVAGQVALDEHNQVVAPGDAVGQTRQVLRRLELVLAEGGAALTDVVTATVFLTSLEHFAGFNQAWAESFGDHRPARATVIAGLLLPGLVVEVQATAVLATSTQNDPS